MADPPRLRSQVSGQRRAAGHAGNMIEEKESEWEEARSSVSASESEAESEYISEGSELSMTSEELDNDDLLDDEDEYQKELAMQRREDEKNGHFMEADPSSFGSPAGANEEDDGRLHSLSDIEDMKKRFLGQMKLRPPAYNVESSPAKLSTQPPATVSARVAAFEAHFTPSPSDVEKGGRSESSAMNVREKEISGCMAEIPIPRQPLTTAGAAATATPYNHHDVLKGDVVGMEKVEVMGVGSDFGSSRNESTSKVVHDGDGSMAATFLTPISMLSDQAFNAPADSPPHQLLFDREHGGKHLQDNSHTSHEVDMHKNYKVCGDHGKLISCDVDMAEYFEDPRKMGLLLNFEEKNHLDLVEARPLAKQQNGAFLDFGPPPLGSTQPPPHQVCPQTLIPAQKQPSPAQPNPKKKTAPKFHLSKFPSPFKLKSVAQSKKTSQAQSNPTSIIHVAQNMPNNSQPKSSLNSKLNDASLFTAAKTDGFAGKFQPPSHPPPAASWDLVMADFPPLESSEHARSNMDVRGSPALRIPAPNPSQTPQDTPLPSSWQSVVPPPKSSWADLMEAEYGCNEENNNTSQPVGNEDPVLASGGQPRVVFGRSMAEVLRSGQPAEGPVLLDRDKSEKRGEVRIVEGKPCLFFSANETSILAGRLGPAIVGKFSHSIPPAHQIQKALGNLKFVGAMSWNFLNAKHVFIELSDMRDYVKLLNGPNNSPVWYIDHHPMRVFKWTPDFDPFFESPITTAWCNILALPVHLFEESSLIAIGEMLGKPVQVDRATINRSRVSYARICVEIDLSRPLVEEIDINIAGKHVTLKVKWEKIPLYCNECKHVGHSAMTCYASGKRPMPPKRDYTRRPPMQSPAAPNRMGDPSQPVQPPATRFAAGPPPPVPRQQPHEVRSAVRQPQEVQQPPHLLRRGQEMEASLPLGASGFFHGSSSAAAPGSQAARDDGFEVPKKNKKNKKAAYRARLQERRRREREQGAALVSRTLSDGEDRRGAEADESSSENGRGSRSLSPSLRLGLGYGPLAMVLHDDNMFGALEDEPSDDREDVDDDLGDSMMDDVSCSRITHYEPVRHFIGYTSPPEEGTPKRARRSASGAHPPLHV